MLGLVGWATSIGRKVGVPKGIFTHVLGGSWSQTEAPVIKVGSTLFQTKSGIGRDPTASSIYPNTT